MSDLRRPRLAAPPVTDRSAGSGSVTDTTDDRRIGARFGRGPATSTIRTRLGWILAAPLTLILVLLTGNIIDQASTSLATNRTAAAVDATLTIQELIHYLQRERGLTNGLLGGETSYREAVRTERGHADKARQDLVALVSEGDLSNPEPLEAVLSELDQLSGLRENVDSGVAARGSTFTWYTDRIRALNAIDLGLTETSDSQLSDGVIALRALGDAKEASARLRGFVNGIFASGRFNGDEYETFAAARAERDAALVTFRRHATLEQRTRGDAALQTPAASEAAGYERIAAAAADGRTLSVDPRAWWATMTTVVDDLRTVQRAVGDDIEARADHLQSQANIYLGGFVLLGVFCLAGGVALALMSARSITRPLAFIAAEANEVSSRRLPEAVAMAQTASEVSELSPPPAVRVPDRATTEMRAMAQALDRVQQTAYSLASEQAVLRQNTTESLANLGRRNQNLLRRQLGFISKLEEEEPDPTALANLFELDHLATRMRRNAESLLVLVGESSPRRWAAPLPMADVIRSAIAEVEEYRRVSIRRIDEIDVVGSAVSEIAHILAELVENALAFSPPDADVEIYGRRMRDRYLVAIVDHGVGMSPTDLARSNARLRNEESFLVAPARFLGHYVVGTLARRLSVDVELNPSPVTGITARVILPASLLTEASDPNASPEPERNDLRVPALPPADPPTQESPRSDPFGNDPFNTDSLTVDSFRVDSFRVDAFESESPRQEPSWSDQVGARQDTPRPEPTPWNTGSPSSNGHGDGSRQEPTRYEPMGRPERPRHEQPRHDSGRSEPVGHSFPVSPGRAPVPGRWVLGQRNGEEIEDTTRVLPALTDPVTGHGSSAPRPPAAPPQTTPGSNGYEQPNRTRNGLVKRQRKAALGTTPTRTPEPADTGPAVDRRPEEVGAMLTSFRAGLHRGEEHDNDRSGSSRHSDGLDPGSFDTSHLGTDLFESGSLHHAGPLHTGHYAGPADNDRYGESWR